MPRHQLTNAQWDAELIATAMLLDCPTPVYDDFGQLQRRGRKYWTITTFGHPTLYGYTKAEVMHAWLADQAGVFIKRNGCVIKLYNFKGNET